MISLHLTVLPDTDVELDELDPDMYQLQREISELDVNEVTRVTDTQVPEAAKSATAATVGALLVTLSPVALKQVVRAVEVWVKNRPVRAVKIIVDGDVLEITRLSKNNESMIVTEFLNRHRDR